jgi:hypothetical protein
MHFLSVESLKISGSGFLVLAHSLLHLGNYKVLINHLNVVECAFLAL